VEVRPATEADIPALLPLFRGYADFYRASPSDEGLEGMMRTLIADPENEGPLFTGLDDEGRIAGFAAMSWKWSSLRGARVGYLEDLFVAPEARGGGLADALIQACAQASRERGAPALLWLTAPTNSRARAVYERSGARGDEFIEYELELG
jgi:GNAT superfamily N-acetyltransferase